jgi:hypothetical protein
LILILTAWLAVVFFGVTLCRLATRSDDSQAAALAEWVASHLPDDQAASADGLAEQLTKAAHRRAYRATG